MTLLPHTDIWRQSGSPVLNGNNIGVFDGNPGNF
jgi:hypothetical protein